MSNPETFEPQSTEESNQAQPSTAAESFDALFAEYEREHARKPE
jgi:hypothetical protein